MSVKCKGQKSLNAIARKHKGPKTATMETSSLQHHKLQHVELKTVNSKCLKTQNATNSKQQYVSHVKIFSKVVLTPNHHTSLSSKSDELSSGDVK